MKDKLIIWLIIYKEFISTLLTLLIAIVEYFYIGTFTNIWK